MDGNDFCADYHGECSTLLKNEEAEYLEDGEEWEIVSEASVLNEDSEKDEFTDVEYLEAEESETSNVSELAKSLRIWFIKNKIVRNSANDFLLILRAEASCTLPKDVRTLLKAPVRVGEQIVAVTGGGHMWYHDIESSLVHYFRDVTPDVQSFELNLSVDGIPMYNRSSMQMWPILMQLHGIPNVPVMVVAIYSGYSKPGDAECILRPLVTELNKLYEKGLSINDKLYSVSLRAIIADSPARAFIKQVCYFNGVHGCLKCKCLGIILNKPRKVFFEDTCAANRTDEEFRKEPFSDKGHRKGQTPLTDIIGFNMIHGVPLGDKFHLIDLGVMKKLLS
uniref:Transposase domain-containing protein n=1 Tax=Anopheles epiroticus TaxID=199890 RepID=A0A182PWU0_9DIPT